MRRVTHRPVGSQGALLVAAIALYLSYSGAYRVPQPDFFLYLEYAIEISELRGVGDFFALPGFSLLMAAVAPFMPGPFPYLAAGKVISLTLAPVCLWLIYIIARRWSHPRTAMIVTTLMAVNPAMMYAAIQPLADILGLACILGVMALAQRRSAWAYLLAGVASLVRYQAVMLIPALVLQDALLARQRERRIRCLLGLLSMTGILSWWIMSLVAEPGWTTRLDEWHRSTPVYGGFIVHTVQFMFAAFPHSSMTAGLPMRHVVVALAVGLSMVGLWRLIREHRQNVIILVSFFVSYTVTHMLWPGLDERFVVPTLWIWYLGLVIGVEVLLKSLRSTLARYTTPTWLNTVGSGGLTIVLLGVGLHLARQEMGPGWLVLVWLVPAVFFAAGMQWTNPWAIARHACQVLVLTCCILGGLGACAELMECESKRYDGAQFRAVGEWYAQQARPGDTMLVTEAHVVGYYARLGYELFLSTHCLEDQPLNELLEELTRRGVTYVVWDNYYAEGPTGDYYSDHSGAKFIARLRQEIPEALSEVHRVRLGHQEAIIYRFDPSQIGTKRPQA